MGSSSLTTTIPQLLTAVHRAAAELDGAERDHIHEELALWPKHTTPDKFELGGSYWLDSNALQAMLDEGVAAGLLTRQPVQHRPPAYWVSDAGYAFLAKLPEAVTLPEAPSHREWRAEREQALLGLPAARARVRVAGVRLAKAAYSLDPERVREAGEAAESAADDLHALVLSVATQEPPNQTVFNWHEIVEEWAAQRCPTPDPLGQQLRVVPGSGIRRLS